jgi:hypothetical protein
MSACFWSGCDEQETIGLDRGRRGDSLSGLRRLWTRAIFPPRFLRGLRRERAGRQGGERTVYATSLVARAATPETRAHVPYNIVLVDTIEGFRMMAHGDNALAIGDRVSARFVAFAGRLVPYFERLE